MDVSSCRSLLWRIVAICYLLSVYRCACVYTLISRVASLLVRVRVSVCKSCKIPPYKRERVALARARSTHKTTTLTVTTRFFLVESYAHAHARSPSKYKQNTRAPLSPSRRHASIRENVGLMAAAAATTFDGRGNLSAALLLLL